MQKTPSKTPTRVQKTTPFQVAMMAKVAPRTNMMKGKARSKGK